MVNKILGWIAFGLSITGVWLNAHYIIWCWPIWIASNIVWLCWSYRKREWSQFSLWIVFLISSIYGWIMWSG